MRILFNWILLPVFALSLAACDSDDGDDNGNGDFGNGSVTVTTEDGTTTFDGDAIFSVDSQDGEQLWSVVLLNGDFSETNDANEAVILTGPGGRPATGDYDFGIDEEAEAVGIYALGDDDDEIGLFVTSESGELTIDESSSSRLEGEFSFTGTGLDFSDPENPVETEVTVRGSFDATFIDPDELPDDEVRPAGFRFAPAN